MRNVLFAVTHALPQIAEAKRLAREWFAAHPREPEPSSPLHRYFCSELQKEETRTSRGKCRPQGNRTYLDAQTPRKGVREAF